MNTRRAIPSMYHRRLVLITAVFLALTVLPAGQLVRLTVVEGSHWRSVAERRLERTSYLPTRRGRVLDRQGRQLAVDRPGYGIAVHYDVITGVWERAQARKQAVREVGRSRWFAMSPEMREVEIDRRRATWTARTERLFSEIRHHAGVDEEWLESRLDAIRRDVQTMRAAVWQRQRERELERSGVDDEAFVFRPGPIREEEQTHVVLPAVSDEAAFEFRRLADELPGMFEVVEARVRRYPWSAAEVTLPRRGMPEPLRSDASTTILVRGVAEHIVGSMRDVQASDVRHRPFRDAEGETIDLGGYEPVGDVAGARGIEGVYESVLRGHRGQIIRRLHTGSEVRVEPRPGADVQLTIDVVLQARVQAILEPAFGLTRVQPWHRNDGLPRGLPLNSAAVVMEVATGEVLAMVSMPTAAMAAEPDGLPRGLSQPWLNRAAEAIYPPGSIIKPLVLAAAVHEGAHSLGDSITCAGHFFPNNTQRLRCWIYRDEHGLRTHGPLECEEAIARSCNIYFYTLADRLGMETLSRWYRRFGLGTTLDAGLLHAVEEAGGGLRRHGESAGTLPGAAEIDALARSGNLRYSSIIMGIGQGPVTWTPLQAANVYATFARGGLVRDATVVADDPRAARRTPLDDLPLEPRVVTAGLEGLRRAVMEPYGSGHHIRYDDGDTEPILNARGLTVWAKTGTAQAPPLRLDDTDGDGDIDSKDDGLTGLDHSWFVGLVGPDGTTRPTYVIAVIVEYGGSGGRVAGPIANQIMRALQEERYLPVEPAVARAERVR